MSWEFAPSPDAAARSALASGKTLVAVVPPAGWLLAPLFDLLPSDPPGLRLVVIVPDIAEARELAATLGWIAALRPLHACTGLARTARLLKAGQVGTLVVTAADALRLAELAALKLPAVPRLAVIRPEAIAALGDDDALGTVLGEAREAQRLLCPAEPAACAEFLAAYAHRAPTWQAVRPPDAPAAEVQVVVCDERQRPAIARELLDQYAPARAFLWEALPSRVGRWMDLARDPALTVGAEPADGPVDLALLPDLPVPDLLSAVTARAARTVVLCRADQLPALRRQATVRVQRVGGEADRARDRAAALRAQVRQRLEAGGLDAELLALGPLFDTWDPAEVAAAALALAGAPAAAPSTLPAWVKLKLDVGKKDGARPADVVGALLNAVGLAKDRVGRVDVRDGFTIVEVRVEDADAALRGLTGISLRGRRVTVRLEAR